VSVSNPATPTKIFPATSKAFQIDALAFVLNCDRYCDRNAFRNPQQSPGLEWFAECPEEDCTEGGDDLVPHGFTTLFGRSALAALAHRFR
jgi:hypothetical protein